MRKRKCLRKIEHEYDALRGDRFAIGELYLFHCTDRACPAAGSLWGIFDRQCDRRIYLETSSRDLRRFERGLCLPVQYRYSRQATRTELRDYIYNLAAWEFGAE